MKEKKVKLKEQMKDLNSIKEKHVAQMMAKLFLCFLSLVWVLVFITIALVVYDKGFYPYLVNYFTPIGHKISTGYSILVGVFCTWYIITVVLIGAMASLRGFKFVGSWKWVNKKDSNAPSK